MLQSLLFFHLLIMSNLICYIRFSVIRSCLFCPFTSKKQGLDDTINFTFCFRELLNCFITKELVRWPKVEEVFKHELATSLYFQLGSDSGKKRWSDLRNRVIEHVRLISLCSISLSSCSPIIAPFLCIEHSCYFRILH